MRILFVSLLSRRRTTILSYCFSLSNNSCLIYFLSVLQFSIGHWVSTYYSVVATSKTMPLFLKL
jgi:hypothetical protein